MDKNWRRLSHKRDPYRRWHRRFGLDRKRGMHYAFKVASERTSDMAEEFYPTINTEV